MVDNKAKGDVKKVFKFLDTFGISKADIGKAALQYVIKGRVNWNTMINGEKKVKTQWDVTRTTMYNLLHVLVLLFLFIWINIVIAKWVF